MSAYPSCYDVIILGAGLAGLRVGIEVLKRFGKEKSKGKRKDLSVCILEKYDYVGGRVITFKKDIDGVGEVQWENGAGRISKSHKKVLSLIKKYGLTVSDISDKVDFLSKYDFTLRPNMFSELIDTYLKPLENLPLDILSRNTLGNLLEKVLGKAKAQSFYIEFPYYSEMHTMRADLALHSFKEEMGTNKGFVVCNEGLSSLTDAMNAEFQKLGGVLIKNMDVVSVQKYGGGADENSVKIECNVIEKECKTVLHNKRVFLGKLCVAALHSEAISFIRGLKDCGVLRHLRMEPLLRLYAVFPPSASGAKKVWFDGIPKVVTDGPLRYIIPINYKKGIVMISYTDGDDAKKFINIKSDILEKKIMKEVRHLFPDLDIPDPVFFKKHPWTFGCTYWLPGNYNVYDESIASLHPLPKKLPGLYMCGESFAIKQCWMESALDQADLLLSLPSFNDSLNNLT